MEPVTRANATLKDRYLLTASLRADGSACRHNRSIVLTPMHCKLTSAD